MQFRKKRATKLWVFLCLGAVKNPKKDKKMNELEHESPRKLQ